MSLAAMGPRVPITLTPGDTILENKAELDDILAAVDAV